jgi:cytochrome c55X
MQTARKPWVLIRAALGLGALALTAAPAAGQPDEGRRSELVRLLRHDCGACHGLELTGGLGPPLTPERLEGRSVAALTKIILNGVPDTPMPPWGRFLTRAEAAWLARHLKEGPNDAADIPAADGRDPGDGARGTGGTSG